MNVRDTTKPTEIERQLQALSNVVSSLEKASNNVSLSVLLNTRKRNNEVIAGLNNLTFCMAFNKLETSNREKLNDPSVLKGRLSALTTRSKELGTKIDASISTSVKAKTPPKKLEIAAAVCAKNYGSKAINVDWSAQEVDGKIEPLLHIQINNVTDKAAFEHSSYHVWARAAQRSRKIEMTTGFSPLPPTNGWVEFADITGITAGLKQFLKQDGF